MINHKEFTERLQKIIDFYNETASSFAEKIGVQRSSISHILSGRNKPSLDFVMKVLNAYPEVELYWLLKGIGNFPFTKRTNEIETTIKPKEKHSVQNTFVENKTETSKNSDIEKIVIFYTDGTFKSYNP
ncbi:helix-turn-helix domain-containing protein [Winogradskyella endarachnes]|uniref:Helix-turn-helix domain-containing protein n=1 Tax=Winogradskyella endarachnes TaxID=2681965 RepID=A0A6L6U4Y9_9FLAO|nr:helix-turn-helix transcriptional regulator [Winogradskyella endarachnes]MUU77205.1 helix-turn-helix domain-containing protein [Winogradskyella endarachnes]